MTLIPALPDTPLGRRLRRHRRAVTALAEQRGAHNIRVFGSVARGELLGVDVDVVPASTLKRTVKENVYQEAIAL